MTTFHVMSDTRIIATIVVHGEEGGADLLFVLSYLVRVPEEALLQQHTKIITGYRRVVRVEFMSLSKDSVHSSFAKEYYSIIRLNQTTEAT